MLKTCTKPPTAAKIALIFCVTPSFTCQQHVVFTHLSTNHAHGSEDVTGTLVNLTQPLTAQHFTSEEIWRRLNTGWKGVDWINLTHNGEKWRNAQKHGAWAVGVHKMRGIYWLADESARYFHPILTKFGISRRFFVKVPNIEFHRNPSSVSRFDTREQTEAEGRKWRR